MRRRLAIAARFLLFHAAMVLVTAILSMAAIRWAMPRTAPSLPSHWSAVWLGLRLTALFGPLLLVPSALGWWFGGRIADHPAIQGLFAALAAEAVFLNLVGFIYPTLLALPIGALLGWLACRRLWPDLPAASPHRPAT